MNHKLAIALIKEYGEKKQRQNGTRHPCPCCGKDTLTFHACSWSRYKPTLICESCANTELPPENWAIVQNPERYEAVRGYFFIFGPEGTRRNYVEIEATSWAEAKAKFHKAYPDPGRWCGTDGLSDPYLREKWCNCGKVTYRNSTAEE